MSVSVTYSGAKECRNCIKILINDENLSFYFQIDLMKLGLFTKETIIFKIDISDALGNSNTEIMELVLFNQTNSFGFIDNLDNEIEANNQDNGATNETEAVNAMVEGDDKLEKDAVNEEEGVE